jgi:p21-activated kinase 1
VLSHGPTERRDYGLVPAIAMDSAASKGQGRRLQKQKQPPPVSFNNSKASTLRRAPSAPTYPSFTSSGADPSTSASSLLRHKSSRSPVHHGSRSPYQVTAPSSQSSLQDKRPQHELVGQPFDADALYRNIAQAQQQVQASQPAPVQLSHQHPHQHPHQHRFDYPQPDPQPSSKARSPALRQSASFSALAHSRMETITPPRSVGDEADAATKTKNRRSDGGKKKGAFSSFVNSVLGSPRRPTISTPTNPMHVTHVSIDNETGEFTVRFSPPPAPQCAS